MAVDVVQKIAGSGGENEAIPLKGISFSLVETSGLEYSGV
jgi:hypothetical protein